MNTLGGLFILCCIGAIIAAIVTAIVPDPPATCLYYNEVAGPDGQCHSPTPTTTRS